MWLATMITGPVAGMFSMPRHSVRDMTIMRGLTRQTANRRQNPSLRRATRPPCASPPSCPSGPPRGTTAKPEIGREILSPLDVGGGDPAGDGPNTPPWVRPARHHEGVVLPAFGATGPTGKAGM